jgi:hypothetical protein
MKTLAHITTKHAIRMLQASVLAVLLAAAGCKTIGHQGFKPDHRFREDIISVATFQDKRSPWLNYDQPARDIPNGIKFPVYLTSRDSSLGVFGDGTLLVDMYLIRRSEDGSQDPLHIKNWAFNTEEAYLFGFREKRRLGWGYQLYLNWSDITTDVRGKEVMFIVSFRRNEGNVVRGKRMYFRVPRNV